jgi:hypothetical protein
MKNQDTKEVYKRVEITSITPSDNYSLAGKRGSLILDTVEIGKSMVITIDDGGFLRTSKVQEINETDSEIEIKTKNSVYTLKVAKEEC